MSALLPRTIPKPYSLPVENPELRDDPARQFRVDCRASGFFIQPCSSTALRTPPGQPWGVPLPEPPSTLFYSHLRSCGEDLPRGFFLVLCASLPIPGVFSSMGTHGLQLFFPPHLSAPGLF